MKTTLALVFFGLAGLGAAGCDSNKSSGSAAAKPAEAAKPAAPASLARDTGIPECTAYLAAMDKFVHCKKLPPEQQELYRGNTEKIYGGLDGKKMKDDKKKETAADCAKALDELKEGAKFRDCPLD
jgi:hypothetical protein